MRVVCIDNKPKTNRGLGNFYLKFLKESKEYEVEFETELSYKLVGIDILPEHIGIIHSPYPTFLQSRFIRISEIDETEMERNYNLEKITAQ